MNFKSLTFHIYVIDICNHTLKNTPSMFVKSIGVIKSTRRGDARNYLIQTERLEVLLFSPIYAPSKVCYKEIESRQSNNN